MTFRADYLPIVRFAERLDALALDTVPAHNYNGLYSEAVVRGDQGWFGAVFGATAEVCQAVSKVLCRAADLTDNSADELTRAACMYHRTDYETARALDETY